MVFNGTNQCPYAITICYYDSAGVSTSDFASPGRSFPYGTDADSVEIWGFPGDSTDDSDCSSSQLQADLAEFTINGSSNTDSYQISNVVCPSVPPASLPFPASFRMLSQLKKKNHMSSSAQDFRFFRNFEPKPYANNFILECLQNAYNLGITINSQGINSCPSPSCSISNITNFCQAPNTLTGPLGDGCYNTDGPNVTSPTSGTLAFANACPDAISYTTDTTGKVFACPTGSDYEIVFSCS